MVGRPFWRDEKRSELNCYIITKHLPAHGFLDRPTPVGTKLARELGDVSKRGSNERPLFNFTYPTRSFPERWLFKT
jgi:hypothetical protein